MRWSLEVSTFTFVSLHGDDLPDRVVVVVVVVDVVIPLVHGDVQGGDVTSLLLIGVNVGISLIRMPTNDIMRVYRTLFLNDVKSAINTEQ